MEKLPPIKGNVVCLTCGCGSHNILSMEGMLAVGFGDVSVTMDDKQVYSECERTEKDGKEWDRFWTGQDAETSAMKDPDHDWRVHFYAPLYEAHYQRQGEKHWVLYEKGPGFA
jgi:hypothetical protein